MISGLLFGLIVDVKASFLGASGWNGDQVPFDRTTGGDDRYEEGVL